MNDPSSVDELSRIFLQIADAPAAERGALLERLCPNDRVRAKVRQLLEADSADDPLLDHALFPEMSAPEIGETIDQYRLVEEIAHGGMGVVYLAEQTEPVQRRVALKVIKPGVDTREVISRFNAERRALSLMDHPNIARVFDAGSTRSGRPYFVMELVDGQPITTHCETKRLSVDERLKLFLSVCRAIQHAHQKGIIHRDIKPSNVIVAEFDGKPLVKVIDFGVAKAIDQSHTQKTVATGLGQIVGTFDYMSPEQSLSTHDIDTRSDIYSLGILLYELLTDTPPFDRERLRSVDLDELFKIIRQEDPPRPSVRLSQTGDATWSETPTRAPGSKPGSEWNVSASETQPRAVLGMTFKKNRRLARQLVGDLDWIVMKALDKDRDRRYSTPNELIAEIERFLAGEAIEARPPSRTYRFRKFLKRHQTQLGVSAAIVTAILIASIGLVYQRIAVAKAESEIAKAESRANVAAFEFFVDDLLDLSETGSASGFTPDPDLKLLTLLRNAQTRVDERLADHPEAAAKIKATLAKSFDSIGQYKDSRPLHQANWEYLNATRGPDDPQTIQARRQLLRIDIDASRLDDVEPVAEELLAMSRRELGMDHPVTLQVLEDRADLDRKQGSLREAVSSYLEILEYRSDLAREDHPNTLATKSKLASVYMELGRDDDAESLYESILEASQSNLDAFDARLAAANNQLGRFHLERGFPLRSSARFQKAVELLRRGWEIYNANRGRDAADTLETQYDLSRALVANGQLVEARGLLEDLVERLGDRKQSNDPMLLGTRNYLGWTLMQLSELAQAEYQLRVADEVLAGPRNEFRSQAGLPKQVQIGPRSEQRLHLQVMTNLANVRYRMGKLSGAVELDERVFELSVELLGKDHPLTRASDARLGLAYLEQGRDDEGTDRLRRVLQSDQRLPGSVKILEALEAQSAN